MKLKWPSDWRACAVRSLREHGWVINTDEQDAHEMLHVLMTTLEEEIAARLVSGHFVVGGTEGIGKLEITELGTFGIF